MNKLFLSLNKTLKARLLANFFRRISTDSLIVFMTIFLALEIGSFYAGLLMICILGLGVYFNAAGGLLSTKLDVKRALIFSEFVHALIILGMFLFIKSSLALTLLLYGLKAIVFSFTIPFGEKLIFDNSDQKTRKSTYQINYWLISVSIPIGMVIGSGLFKYGVEYLILASFFFSFASMLIYIIFLPDQGKKNINLKEKSSEQQTFKDYTKVFRNRPAALIIFSAACLCTIEFSFLQYFPVYISQSNFQSNLLEYTITPTDLFALARSVNALVVLILGYILASYISRNIGFKQSTYFILVYILIFIMSFYLLDTPLVFLISIGFMSLMGIIYSPIRQTLFAETIEQDVSGLYFSIYSLTGRVGNITAAVILMLSEFFSHSVIVSIFLLLGITSFLALQSAINMLSQKEKIYD